MSENFNSHIACEGTDNDINWVCKVCKDLPNYAGMYLYQREEYELRKKIADAIQNDVDRVFSEKLQLFNHDFYYEILFPLIVLEMNYKMKSEESLAAGLGDSNEYLILVNPLREAIYWYIHRVLISDRKISFSKPLNSDIDVAMYDKIGKKLLIIECKWKEENADKEVTWERLLDYVLEVMNFYHAKILLVIYYQFLVKMI